MPGSPTIKGDNTVLWGTLAVAGLLNPLRAAQAGLGGFKAALGGVSQLGDVLAGAQAGLQMAGIGLKMALAPIKEAAGQEKIMSTMKVMLKDSENAKQALAEATKFSDIPPTMIKGCRKATSSCWHISSRWKPSPGSSRMRETSPAPLVQISVT